MNISFDKFEQFEAPVLTLCNPNSEATIKDGKVTLSNTLGMLSDCKKVNLSPNFNTQWELSFEFSDSKNEQLHYMYKRLEKGRYIYVSDVGYFMIDDYTRHESDERVYKEISCHSVDKETERNECPLLDEGSYYFYTKDNQEGIIQKQMVLLPKWTLGFVSDDLKDKTAYFDGENKSDNAYKFLWEEIEEAYECVIDVDFISRTLSFYSLEYYAAHHKTDIHLSKSNDLKEVTIESKDDDCFTAITVKQNDNLSLVYSNPNGSETLYNFTHCFSDMSSKLQVALTKWQEKYEATIIPYRTLSEQWANALDDLSNAEKDLDILKEELNNLKRDKDTVINATASEETKQANLNTVNANISAKEQAIFTQENVIATKKSNIKTTYEDPLQAYADECSLSLTAKDISGNLIFTQDLLNELSVYINPAEYSDEYISQTDDMKYTEIYQQSNKLFDRAKRELEKLSTQSYTFSVDNNSFLFNKKFERFSKQLMPGAIVYLETSDDHMEQVHLTNFSIDYDDRSVSFTFGNKYDENDIKSLFDDVFGSVKTSAAAVKYLKNIVNDQRSELDKQRDWIDNALTLTKNHFLTSNNQSVIIDDSGYWGRRQSTDADGNLIFDTKGNPIYDNEQLRIVNNTIAITKDNWQRIATAIGKIYLYHDDATGEDVYEYGVAGKLLLGEMIIGKTLSLLGSPRADGTYAITLNENGLTIINDGTSAGMTIQDAYGNKQFYADSNGNLHLSAAIVANSGNIAELTLSAGAMFRVNGWAESNGYVGYSSGLNAMYANSSGRDIFLWVGEHRGGNLEYNSPEGFDNAWTEELSAWDWKAVSPHWSMTVQDSIKNSAPFYVTWDGALHASNAYVKGEITATSGNVGGWDIGSGFLRSTYDLNGTKYVGMGLNDVTFAFFAGASNPVGSDGVFRVGHDGSLYAENATIKGNITATSGSFTGQLWSSYGSIGNWSISDYSLVGTASDGLSSIGLYAYPWFWHGGDASTGRAADAIVVRNGDTYPFVVRKDGYLSATNANITGTINANAGKFGIWNISNSSKNGVGGIVANDGTDYIHLSTKYVYGNNVNSGYDLLRTWAQILTSATGSDKRFKNNILPLSDKIENFYNDLSPRVFNYIEGMGQGNPLQKHFGLIAQDVLASVNKNEIKNLALIDETDGYYYLRYQELIALNIWQIQKLKKEISLLKKRLSNIE